MLMVLEQSVSEVTINLNRQEHQRNIYKIYFEDSSAFIIPSGPYH